MKRLTVILGVAVLLAAAAAAGRAQSRPRAAQDVVRLDGSSIGVTVRDLTSEEQSKANVPRGDGVYVSDVREDTPAARAGFQAGDIVVEFDGETVRSAQHFARLVRETRPGDTVPAVVTRNGARQTLQVTPEERTLSRVFPPDADRLLKALPRDLTLDFDFDVRDRLGLLSRSAFGATVTALTPQLAEYFGVEDGVLVSSIAAESRAAQAGLRAGDVIIAANGATIRNPADLRAALRRTQTGSTAELRVMRERKEVTLTVPAAPAPVREQPTPGVRLRGRPV